MVTMLKPQVGQLKLGYFYELVGDTPPEDDYIEFQIQNDQMTEEERAEILSSATTWKDEVDKALNPFASVECPHYKSEVAERCRLNPKHILRKRYRAMVIDFQSEGPPLSPFVPREMGFVFVSEWMKNQIESVDLTGAHFQETEITVQGSTPTEKQKRDLKVYNLNFEGKDCSIKSIVEPEEKNRCPACSYAPIVCSCGEVNANLTEDFTLNCPKCNRRCVYPLTELRNDNRDAIFLIGKRTRIGS